MIDTCDSTKVTLCWQVKPIPIYVCDDPNAQLIEVLVFDDIGNVIPHDSEDYPVEDSGFVGDGEDYIRSYFADKNLKPIDKADEPTTWQYEPCGGAGADPVEGCNPETGYRVLTGTQTFTPPTGTLSVTIGVIRGNSNVLATANGSGTMSRRTVKSFSSNYPDYTDFTNFSVTAGGGNSRVEIHFQVCP